MPAKARTAKRPKPPAARKMPKFKPAPGWITELFASLIRDFPEAVPRKMFGYPCAFVRGQMFAGVFGDRLMLRLAEEDRARFLKLPGARPFEPMPGRPMKEYVEAPKALAQSPELKKWLAKSLAYASALPPKEKKKK